MTAQGFAGLVREALAGHAVDPSRLCRACVPVVAMDHATVLAEVADGPPETAGASGVVAAELSDLQLRCGDGPTLESLHEGRAVLVPDAGLPWAAARWPVFAAAHAGPLAGSLYCLPLHHGAIRVGVLTVARDDTRPLTPPELATLVDTAATFTTLMLLAGQADAVVGEADEPEGVWPFGNPLTDEVHQATGMITAQLDVPIAEAYLRLRAHAFAHGRPLAAVAREVVSRQLRFTPDEGSTGPAGAGRAP